MFLDEFRSYCLAKAGVEETLPFGPDTLVFKVAGKMFALAPIETGATANLKCDPERAIELRDQYPDDIRPGYHMNKKHWNTVSLQGLVPDELIEELTDHSYELIVQSLPAKTRKELGFD